MTEWICEEHPDIAGWSTVAKIQELIRCKDCEYHRNRINMCDTWHRHTSADGFCHRARKVKQND